MTNGKNKFFAPLLCIVLGVGILVTLLRHKDNTAEATPEIQDTATEAVADAPQEHYDAPNLLEIPKLTQSRQEQIIEHKAYTVSYNSDWRIPNWVAYELTRSEASGNGERADYFEPDPEVRGASASYKDYSSSKYDRGHMAPAGDMKWDRTAMEECFYLSNICPQDHNLNSGDWNDLEMQIRYWAKKYGNVYITCGPIMSDNPETIGRNEVAVPDAFYKVCLCQINGSWQGIGFIFENKAGHQRLKNYCKSIDEVEKITGIDFFPKLEDKIENRIEASFSASTWGLK